MSIHSYVVSAQKPTATNAAVTGAFTAAGDRNLLVAKYNRVEVYVMTREGLSLACEVPFNARIAAVHLFRAQGQDKDWLLVCTERHQFAVLSHDPDKRQVKTVAAGTTKNDVGRPTPGGLLSAVDPDGRLFVVHEYVGMLKVVPMDKTGRLQEAFTLRLDELNVVAIDMLHGCPRPTIAVLYQDTKDERHLKTYECSVADRALVEGPWKFDKITSDSLLIPVPKPAGGVVAVGPQSITYGKGQTRLSIMITPGEIVAHGIVDADGRRILLGDSNGSLSVLTLTIENGNVVKLDLEKLGTTSRPSCLCYLANDVVYVGSNGGDSQLINLRQEPGEDGSKVQLLEVYTNIGPIVDFAMIDLERHGQGQMITCSGIGKDGSLRVVRSGVGINEAASIELPGIKGIWPLRASSANDADSILAVSFIGQTRFLAFDGDDPVDSDIAGFTTEEQSLLCANLRDDLLVQVTAAGVRIADSKTHASLDLWSPPAGVQISFACATASQLLLATTGGHVVYLEAQSKRLREMRTTKLPSEISCMDAGPVGADGRADICAIGLWADMSVRLLRLSDFHELTSEHMGGDYIPRSVSLTAFEKQAYMLVGLGDGQLCTFQVDPTLGALSERRKVAVGTQPISLNTFKTAKAKHVFVATDRPTIVHESNGKLLFANLNAKDVNFMAPFSSEAFADSIAVASDSGLTIGTIDGVQKLHIQTVPLGEEPRRIAYQESSLTLAVGTVAPSDSTSMDNSEVGRVRLIDSQTFEMLDTLQLDADEHVTSVMSKTFENGDALYIVGSAFVLPNEDFPTHGRIRVLQTNEARKLRPVASTDVKGAVYSLAPLSGNKIVAGINSSVAVYDWSEPALTRECDVHAFVYVLGVKTRGDFVVAGDLLKSVTMYRYKAEDKALEEIGRDSNPVWTTTFDIIDDETIIVADNDYNLCTLKKNVDSIAPEESNRLEVAGLFHFGDQINQCREGSLVMKSLEQDGTPTPTRMFVTVSGAIGVIASVSQERYTFFKRVQDNMSRVIHGVGGFEHATWRNFNSEYRSPDAFNFLDGDLIEQYLLLDEPYKEAVVTGRAVTNDHGGPAGEGAAKGGQPLPKTAAELTREIDELARLH